jgi:putative ABC transport system permease protein
VLNLRETIHLSLESVAAHTVRSILTVLGVVFGVGAVVAMLSIGEGARQETLEQISVMGLHNIIIRPVSEDAQKEKAKDASKVTNSIGLSMKDAQAILAICPFAEKVEANALHNKLAFHGGEHADVPVIGVSPAYQAIYNTKMREGRFISDRDLAENENYCVLGYSAKQKLFSFKSALGEHVKLGDQWFTVIGIVEEKPEVAKFSGAGERDINLDVYVPLTTVESKFGREKDAAEGDNSRVRINGMSFGGTSKKPQPEIDEITVQLTEDADAAEAASVISRILARRHNKADDFTITVPEQLLKQRQATQRIFNVVMIAIASISLLVGGIGIMNIMLSSVLERTREIGVRRALGATQRVVVMQFLTESVILSMLGGLIGVAIGFGMTKLISTYAEWRTVITPISVIVAFGVSVATGIIFGYYPARQAARKDPIDALRYE